MKGPRTEKVRIRVSWVEKALGPGGKVVDKDRRFWEDLTLSSLFKEESLNYCLFPPPPSQTLSSTERRVDKMYYPSQLQSRWFLK